MRILLLLVLVTDACAISNCNLKISRNHLLLELREDQEIQLKVTCFNETDAYGTILQFLVQNEDVVKVEPPIVIVESINDTYLFYVEGTSPGHAEVVITSADGNFEIEPLYLTIDILRYQYLNVISQVVGWIYILSWGISYYPQIYLNNKRKSVVGLNFDFVALNITGYVLYGVFILSVFFVDNIQDEYFGRYPRGLIPVKINDVVYNLHGVLALSLTVIQCIIFEKGDQTVSIFGRVTLSLILLFALTIVLLAGFDVIPWLDFLYYCSYNKVIITALKYIPQAYMNYRRKSTYGWSIGLVILQLSGGVFSLLQMVLDSHNYNDWVSIIGNPTKFLVGILNVIFPIFFIVQHFLLYKQVPAHKTEANV